MADMSWEHAAEARAALNAIVTDPEHGVAALSSAQTMSNLLKDLLPDAPREKSMLVAAAEAGLAGSLREHVAQGMDPSTAIRLTASSFSATTPFTPEACSWVAGEIAIALGISTPAEAGPPAGGPPGFDAAGQAPSGFDSAGQQGMATQMPSGFTPGPPESYPPAPGAGYPQAPPSGFPQAPGYQQAAPGYPQAAPSGYPQAPTQAARPGMAPGQGQAYPQGYPQQVPGQGGYGGGGIGGAPPAQAGAWQAGGPYGTAGGMPGGGIPGGPKRSKRGLFVVLGLLVVLVVIIVVAVTVLGGNKKPSATTGSTTPPAQSSSPTPTPPVSTTPPTASGVEPLSTIMNPTGLAPVGTSCTRAITNGLNAATLTGRTFCSKTTATKTVVWGYQFDNKADYRAGFAHINSYTGFSSSGASSTCPPAGGSADGSTGWHANSNPKYKSRNGQILECYVDHAKSGTYPILVWTMPTQNVVFISEDRASGGTLTTLVNWWKTLNYG
jgi:hypothetical protein